MNELIKRNGDFTKEQELMFWLRFTGCEGVQRYIDNLKLFMGKFLDNGQSSFSASDRDTIIKFVATVAEMKTIIKKTQEAPAYSLFSVQQIEIINLYLDMSRKDIDEILENTFTGHVFGNLEDYPFENLFEDNETDSKLISDIFHLARNFNVNIERLENIISKQQFKLENYQKEITPSI